jgi:Tubulin-tyrosine ligase family
MLLEPLNKSQLPTVFCNYPKICEVERSKERAFYSVNPKIRAKFKISNAVRYAAVLGAFKAGGFVETESNNWNVLWSPPIKSETLKGFTKYQKCNHFPSAWQLGRKDNLWMNFQKMKRLYGNDYDFCPQTYIFPDDYNRFLTEREGNIEHMYIMKPVASACGKGIQVFGKGQAVPKKAYHH